MLGDRWGGLCQPLEIDSLVEMRCWQRLLPDEPAEATIGQAGPRLRALTLTLQPSAGGVALDIGAGRPERGLLCVKPAINREATGAGPQQE